LTLFLAFPQGEGIRTIHHAGRDIKAAINYKQKIFIYNYIK